MNLNPWRSRRGRRAMLALPLSAAVLLGGAGVATATGYSNSSQSHHELGDAAQITPRLPLAPGDVVAVPVVPHHAND